MTVFSTIDITGTERTHGMALKYMVCNTWYFTKLPKGLESLLISLTELVYALKMGISLKVTLTSLNIPGLLVSGIWHIVISRDMV